MREAAGAAHAIRGPAATTQFKFGSVIWSLVRDDVRVYWPALLTRGRLREKNCLAQVGIPIVEQAIETAALMLGSDKSRVAWR